jgi:Flp pilus assembly protein TadD
MCRNVLIYFDTPVVERVMGLMEQALQPGGVLLIGAADALARTATRSSRPTGPARVPQQAIWRAHTPEPSLSRDQRLAAALDAASSGKRDEALAHVRSLLADNQLDAHAHFVHGLVTLEAGEPARAAAAFRRALCTDPTFALAAFTLGRAYDALGDKTAARRAYEQALRTLDPSDDRQEQMLQQVDIGDIAMACRARLGGDS